MAWAWAGTEAWAGIVVSWVEWVLARTGVSGEPGRACTGALVGVVYTGAWAEAWADLGPTY